MCYIQFLSFFYFVSCKICSFWAPKLTASHDPVDLLTDIPWSGPASLIFHFFTLCHLDLLQKTLSLPYKHTFSGFWVSIHVFPVQVSFHHVDISVSFGSWKSSVPLKDISKLAYTRWPIILADFAMGFIIVNFIFLTIWFANSLSLQTKLKYINIFLIEL